MKQRCRHGKTLSARSVIIIIAAVFSKECFLMTTRTTKTTTTTTTTIFVTALPIRSAILDTKEKKKNRNSDLSDRIRDASSGILPNEDNSIGGGGHDSFNAPFIRTRKTYAASAAEAIRDAARGAWNDAVRSASLVTQPPRDIVDGVWRGFSNLYRGYAAAATAIAGLPWDAWELMRNAQMKSGYGGGDGIGLAGFAMGAAHSTTSSTIRAAASLVGGIATCLYQMATGIYATPFALRASVMGMVWDKDRADWSYYSLDGESRALQKYNSGTSSHSSRTSSTTTASHYQLRGRRRNVRDRSYYNLLSVPVDATSEEIRTAYRREALLSHPDKNPRADSEAAAERFLNLHSAYRTLSDNESRDAYDEHGICYREETEAMMDSASDIPEVDPYIFFAVLFGSASVEPYIGELRIASVIDNFSKLGSHEEEDDDDDDDASKTESERNSNNKKAASSLLQKKRAVRIALHLRDRVSSYMPSGMPEEQFRISCRKEAESIAKGDFGDIYLTAIGSALLHESDQFLGLKTSMLGMKGRAVQAKSLALTLWRKLGTRAALVKTASISIGAVIKTTREKVDDDNGEAKDDSSSSSKDCGNIHRSKMKRNARVLDKLEQVSLSNALQLAWKYNIEDIQDTLKLVCGKLFADGEQLPFEGERRAEAVRILGEEFFVVGKTAGSQKEATSDATKDFHAHDVEAAFVASLVMVSFVFEKNKRRTLVVYVYWHGITFHYFLFMHILTRNKQNDDDDASRVGTKKKARRRSS
mmetsp:Transcript_11211/g.16515  ORF Transcript_11211/g.16515 Transcript_11211/m.16515 type:complete len:758 (+) Transcript_11211:50-2323(+)